MGWKLLKYVGALLVVAALIIAGQNIYEEQFAANAAVDLGVLVSENIKHTKAIYAAAETEVVPDYVLNSEAEMPVVSVERKDVIGEIYIPSQNIRLPVLAEWSEAAAKFAPCRYMGSAYTDDMIIAGHNYKKHFKNLSQLLPGDEVCFTDMDGNEFQYKVAYQETINGSDVEGMASGEWDLTLFTCTYGGKNRQTIRCIRTDSDNKNMPVSFLS